MPTKIEFKPGKSKPYSFAAPVARKLGVDRNLGLITDVALITAGVEAKGHGIYIDDKTLTTAQAVLDLRGGRLKFAVRHLSWAEYFECDDRVENFPGWFSGCAVKGQQLVAARLEFYDVFKTGEETKELFARILEMAEKTPELVGISLEPWGYLVYVGEDGVEYSERPKDIPLKYDGLPALRVTEIFFGALVDEPAANPGGLFAQLSRKFSTRLSDSEIVTFLRGLFAAEQPAAAASGPVVNSPATAAPVATPALAAPGLVNSTPSTETKNPAAVAPELSSITAMKEILQSIKAEFGAVPAKFSQAMSIFGQNPEITFAALKAEMVQLDLAASTAQVTTLTTELGTVRTSLTTVTAERDDWKKKYDELKASGAGTEVPLGATSAGAGEENPWAAGSVNLTKQAEITNADPKRAEALKAAAATAKK